MSILIKGMEMPKACVYRKNGYLITCPLYDIDGYCGALNTEASHKENVIFSDCPLVPVPPHGRLIDADALFDFILNIYKTAQGDARKAYRDVLDVIVAAGDVIPAEEGET